MGAVKQKMLEDLDKEEQVKRNKAQRESVIGMAYKCVECGEWFPETVAEDGQPSGEIVCEACWQKKVEE